MGNKLKYIQLFLTIFFASLSICNENIRVGFWTSSISKCGIKIYTQHLHNSLTKLGYSSFIYPGKINIEELFSKVNEDKINILDIQFEPSLFNLHTFFSTILKLKEKGIKIIFEVHSENISEEFMSQAINLSDQCIYHKPSRFFQMNEKLNIIPLGIPVFNTPTNKEILRTNYGFKKRDIILTTCGFMFEMKKHATILEMLVPIIKNNQRIKVQLLTSYGDVNYEHCKVQDKKIKNVINKYNLTNQVIHLTNFLPQQELNERLYISDLGYLWGGIEANNQAATSAAAKEFLAARLPLVVTESSHYHNIDYGVIKTKIDYPLFIKTIENTLEKISRNPNALKNLRRRLNLTYSNLNYDNLINKHIEVFNKLF